jgi:hypothetical protein
MSRFRPPLIEPDVKWRTRSQTMRSRFCMLLSQPRMVFG